MKISKAEFAGYIKDFRLKELFLDLGWDNDRTPVPPVQIGDMLLSMRIVADKNGFKIIECQTADIPSYAGRVQAANALKKLFHEHLLIFYNTGRTEQVWLYCYNLNSQNRKAELRHGINQDVERLYQRASGLIFELDEQDNITIVDVTARVRGNFAANAEKVTKRFYDAFKKQHTALLGFIAGIQSTVDREWYASIMLNRLMFCYFMQRRGFLNKDRDYLRNKLKESRERLGKGKFYSFYRDFLLVLFQKGFGTDNHTPEIRAMIGEIPYLNGGLFDLHLIEQSYPDIDITDEAFENIFDLFDRYEWHLDTRDCATGNEISPDVLGYIFEKYINDRSSMGAYYTQEDITGYISRSTILPWLLESVKKTCPKAFEANGSVWSFLKESGDAYIFDSVRHGADKPLPEHIAIGLDTTTPGLLERRGRWNEPAPAEYALPTEIWREVVERRIRYEKVRGLISSGEIKNVADFITYNLDIVGFVTDLLDTIEDPKFIQAFYAGLEKITILDPTCGSGAFLFAALNLLEPLYASCLSRMDDYLNHDYKGILDKGVRRFFEEKLEMMESDIHPSKNYFIYKSIILNNLYGVDIMREAAETAKLRLFLKLVSTVDPDYGKENIGIEPLPDIDFNIKAGNTLIGYANEKEVEEAIKKDLFSKQMSDETKAAMSQMAKATARYKQLQLGAGDYRADDFRQAKNDLSSRQSNLKKTLDALLRKWDYSAVSESDWNANYMPFHWVSEFYSIIVENGGFDVIIGNPPYVEYSIKNITYQIKDIKTITCKDLYAFVIEKAEMLLSKFGHISMITPISIISTDGFLPLREFLYANFGHLRFSSYSMRPAKLFDGVEKRLSVFIANRSQNALLYSSKYFVWNTEYRPYLFKTIYYSLVIKPLLHNTSIPKIGSTVETSILSKILQQRHMSMFVVGDSENIVFHTRKLRYFLQFLDTAPKIFDESGNIRVSSELKKICYQTNKDRLIANAVFLSSLFFWYYISYSDCRNLNKREIMSFPFDFSIAYSTNISEQLENVSVSLLKNLQDESYMVETNYKQYGLLRLQAFKPRLSKPMVDQIDTHLAKIYGFTDEELDYIINYDIKYRMGIGGGSGDDE